MWDWSSRSENHGLMASQDYVLSFALIRRLSDRTSSSHLLDTHCVEQLLAPSIAFAAGFVLVAAIVLGSGLGSGLVDGSPAAVVAVAQLSVSEESM